MAAADDKKQVLKKARRRIKRFIKTGEPQARVRVFAGEENVYEYKVKHHVKSIFFKADKIGRLREWNKHAHNW